MNWILAQRAQRSSVRAARLIEIGRAPGGRLVDPKVIKGRSAGQPSIVKRGPDGGTGGEATALDVVEGKVCISGQAGADADHVVDGSVSLRFGVVHPHGGQVVNILPVVGLRHGGSECASQ